MSRHHPLPAARRRAAAGVLAAFATLLAGCSGSTHHGATSTSSGDSATVGGALSGTPISGSSSASAGGATSGSAVSGTTGSSLAPSGSGGAALPYCLNDIRVTSEVPGNSAGHRVVVLLFNNVGTQACNITGYPGADEITASGATVIHLTRTLSGMAGGAPDGSTAPPRVVLRPGATVSALAEARAVPQGGLSDCGDFVLKITVPNAFASSTVRDELPRCEAQIHPVVYGTTGGLR